MRPLLCGPVAALTLTLSLAAQVAPAIVKTTASTATTTPPVALVAPRIAALGPALLTSTSTGVPGTGLVGQIEMRDLSTSTFRVGSTLSDGPLGAGFMIYEGVYDASSRTYAHRQSGSTLTTQNLDQTGSEFSLSILHDGLLCVWEVYPPGGGDPVIYWSRRDNDGDVWGAPWMAMGQPAFKPILGVPSNRAFGDSKVFMSKRDLFTGDVLPTPKLYYTGGNFFGGATGAIFLAEIQIAGTSPNETATLVNIQRFLREAPFGGVDIHSAHPVSDAQGNVFGWVLNANLDRNGEDDTVFVPYLNTSQGFHVAYDDPDRARLNNGTSMGLTGNWFFAHDQPSATQPNVSPDPFEVCVVAMTGDTWPAATGGRVNLRVMVPYSATDTWFIQVWAGLPLTPFPIVAPPTIGNGLGTVGSGRPPAMLGVSPTLLLPALTSAPGVNPGGVTYSFRVPALVGALDVQPIAWNVSTGLLYLGNTATMASR